MEWCRTPIPLKAPLKYLVEELWSFGAYIAGGFAVRLLYPDRKASDIDVFFEEEDLDQEDQANAAVEAIRQMWSGEVRYENEFSTALTLEGIGHPVNFIKPRNIEEGKYITYGSPAEVLPRFDFVNCCAALRIHEDRFQVVYHPELDEWEQKNQLKLNTITCPIANLKRSYKYVAAKGYKGLMIEDLIALIKTGAPVVEELDEEERDGWYEKILRVD